MRLVDDGPGLTLLAAWGVAASIIIGTAGSPLAMIGAVIGIVLIVVTPNA